MDDPYYEKIISTINSKIVTYGFSPKADIYPVKYNFTDTGLNAKISIFKKLINISTTLIGVYNLYNILASIGAAYLSKLSLKQIASSLNKPIYIPGRLEMVYNKNNKMIIIDYAHTPDAFDNVLKTISNLKSKKIITVFGCGGNRDISKRESMATIAEKYSSIVIVTSDNPRTESLNKIFSDIKSGFKHNNHTLIADRKEALLYAVKKMESDSQKSSNET